jgi:perosamine synthetase
LGDIFLKNLFLKCFWWALRNKEFDFFNYLSQCGIPSDILRYNYKVLYKYPVLKNLQIACKNAENLAGIITTIPVHPGLNNSELDYIIDQINAFT